MTDDARPPFAAYGPAGLGYGPTPSATAVAVAPDSAPKHPVEPPQPFLGAAGGVGRASFPSSPRLPPPGTRPRALGIVALVLSLVGAAAVVGRTTAGVGWFLLVAAVVCGIVQVARRSTAKGAAIVALVVALVATLVGLVAAVFGLQSSASTGSDSGQEAYPEPALVLVGEATQTGLPFGVPVRIGDRDAGADVWQVAAGAPVDVTALARDAGAAAPENGVIAAVPFTLTNLTGSTVDLFDSLTEISLDAELADGQYPLSVYAPAPVPGYPTPYSLDARAPAGGSITVYRFFDVTASDLVTLTPTLWLSSGDRAAWAPTPAP